VTSTGWDLGGTLPAVDGAGAPGDGVRDDPPGLHERVQAGPEFRELRRRMRGFAFPMAAAFLLWYLAFVLLASYARELMATPVLGVINLGLLIGLAQFVTTFALTAAYVRYAERRLDPLAAHIREQVEGAVADRPGDAR
jgi:uncharacterized membrane protein (DUF485 family)